MVKGFNGNKQAREWGFAHTTKFISHIHFLIIFTFFGRVKLKMRQMKSLLDAYHTRAMWLSHWIL